MSSKIKVFYPVLFIVFFSKAIFSPPVSGKQGDHSFADKFRHQYPDWVPCKAPPTTVHSMIKPDNDGK